MQELAKSLTYNFRSKNRGEHTQTPYQSATSWWEQSSAAARPDKMGGVEEQGNDRRNDVEAYKIFHNVKAWNLFLKTNRSKPMEYIYYGQQ